MTRCALLVDPPAPGPWNMAVDEGLLDWAAQTGGRALRFYPWDEPTLSLGYFQDYDDRFAHEASRSCPVVRRSTGGGAIVHDAEITYALVVPAADRFARDRLALYRAVHEALARALAGWGLEARLCSATTRPSAEPFLCFARRTAGDLLIGDAKIAGSAQRRAAGAVLQHGSVLVERSPAAPELPGLNDLASRPLLDAALIEAWRDELGAAFGWRWERSPLEGLEHERIRRLAEAKFENEAWTRRRRLPIGPATESHASDRADSL